MLVKKYGNRRLYDTESSRYVTLEEIAERVYHGEDLRVVDAKTGHDLTQNVLAQIILEGRGAAKLLPVPLLKQLVQLRDDALSEFFGRYITWALEVYLRLRSGTRSMLPFDPFAGLSLAPPVLSRFFGVGGARGRGRGGVMGSAGAAAGAGAAGAAARWDEGEVAEGDPGGDPEEDVADANQGAEIAALRRELEELRALVQRGIEAREGEVSEASEAAQPPEKPVSKPKPRSKRGPRGGARGGVSG